MNILLIEDNLSIIKGLTYYFNNNGYNLAYKTKIKDAIKYLKENKQINLIILDITLPDGNGVELYKNEIINLKIPTIFFFFTEISFPRWIYIPHLSCIAVTSPFSTRKTAPFASPLTAFSLHAVIKTCIFFTVSKTNAWRLSSSSPITSSSRITGASALFLKYISAWPSFITSAAVFFCPCEPNSLIFIPFILIKLQP